jgi:hypothetical protein
VNEYTPPTFQHAADDAYAYARRARDLAGSTTHLGHDTGCTLAYRRMSATADHHVRVFRHLEATQQPPVDHPVYRHRVSGAETMLRHASALMGDES